ncbi:MAG TPA: hypothetical protein VIE88_09085 [Vicinamibacteria bacterium]|jgi:hypothetical protein
MKIDFVSGARLFTAALVPVFLFAARPALAGDTFFKGGVIFQPRDVGFEGRWRVAFGSDYAVNLSETLFAGFEVQTSVFRQDVVESGPTATVVPLNAFGNVKFKSGGLGARPFGGAGLGLVSNFQFVSNETEWANDVGWHILGGVEFGHLLLELQVQGAFDSDADTEFTGYVGFVW